MHTQSTVNIDRDDLASAVRRGGIQASNFRRAAAEWANNNESNWTVNYTNNTLGKQYDFLFEDIGNFIKTTFEKKKKTEHTIRCKELTSRRIQLLEIR